MVDHAHDFDEVITVDVGRGKYNLVKSFARTLDAVHQHISLQGLDHCPVAHAVGDQVYAICVCPLYHLVEHPRQNTTTRTNDRFVDRICGSRRLRGPAENHGRAVEIEVVGKLTRTPCGIFERIAVSVNKKKHVVARRVIDVRAEL